MVEKTAKKKTASKKTGSTASKSKAAKSTATARKSPAKSAAKKSPAKSAAKKSPAKATAKKPAKSTSRKSPSTKSSNAGLAARAKKALTGTAGVVLAGAAVGAVLEVVREVKKASNKGGGVKAKRLAGKTLEGAVNGAVAATNRVANAVPTKPEVPAILDIADGKKKKKPAKKK